MCPVLAVAVQVEAILSAAALRPLGIVGVVLEAGQAPVIVLLGVENPRLPAVADGVVQEDVTLVTGVEVPTIEVPAVEVPAVELLAVEVSAIEVRTVEVLAVEVPDVELLAIEVSAIEVLAVEVPAFEVPAVEVLAVELPAFLVLAARESTDGPRRRHCGGVRRGALAGARRHRPAHRHPWLRLRLPGDRQPEVLPV